MLLAHALGVPPAHLIEAPMRAVPTGSFEALIARRAAREPLALIVGHREFWSLDFAASPDTLVPRADSETLIEAALAEFPARDAALRMLDLGTGTGCLLLAGLHEFPAAFGVGVDRLPAVAALARRNAASLGLAGRAAFVCADWAAPLAGRFDLVLCNPPYIPAAEVATLMPEVALHEPASALDGGSDGLDSYRAVIPRLPGLLAPGGGTGAITARRRDRGGAGVHHGDAGRPGGHRPRPGAAAGASGRPVTQPRSTKKQFGSLGCGG
jgi:release factor glutamine methyltransferase